jgi:subfamily B ATP-binding cassette protein MsbA
VNFKPTPPWRAAVRGDLTLALRLGRLIKPHWRRLLLAVICMLLVSAATAASAYLVKPVMDEIFLNRDAAKLALMPAAILMIFAVKGAGAFGQSYLMQYVGERIITEYRIMLFSHIQKLPLRFFDNNSTGEIMSRITNDVTRVQGAASSVITSLLRDFFSILGLTAVILLQDWLLGVFALLIFPVCMLPLVKFGRMLRRVTTSSQESMGRIMVAVHESMGGIRIVKGFCREDYEAGRFSLEAMTQFRLRMKDVFIRALSSPLMEFLGGVGIAAILFYGGWQVIHGVSTPGTFFSFLAALIMLYEPVKRLSNINNDIQSGLAALIRIYEVLDTPAEIEGGNGALAKAPTLRKAIDYQAVSFAYEPGRMVLDNISLHVPSGSILALVGGSGGGKTTLVNLLPRFYPVAQGKIMLDGRNINDYTLEALRSQIAIVTQQTFLFNDTVRANIAYGRMDAGEEEIKAAAEAAYAMDFISDLPKGLDSLIGESGVLLSGGERQRISIARALLANRPILILDEATSNLDTESEMYVQKALENLMRGRTAFVIAHRLSTVRQADHIVVINEGRIAEEGAHDQLLFRGGLYKKLHDMQFQINAGQQSV